MPAGIPLGPYVLVRRLATGGMAEIFLARREGPEGFARDLVVKRILPHLAEDRSFIGMFLEEARIAARLTHPNVVQVYDFGEAEGSYYLAMELVRGVDLRALIERAVRDAHLARRGGALPAHHAAKIMSFACEGLAHAHALAIDGRPVGLVHRDLTPSNVLVSFEGAVKLADFGIAKADTGRQRDDTRIGLVKGKYAYMSPEQARGDHLDARSDIFNVGVLLFEAVTGDTLFPHDDYRAAKMMSAAGRVPEPERIEQLPPPLARIVKRALADDRQARYPDALALRAELEAFLRTWPATSDQLEIGRWVQRLFPDVVEEDRRAPRAAGTVPETVAVAITPADSDPLPASAKTTAHESPLAARADGVFPEEVTEEIPLDTPAPRAGQPTVVASRQRARRRARWPLWAAAVALLGSALGVGAYLALAGDDGPPPADDWRAALDRGPLVTEPPSAPPGRLRVRSEPLGLPVFVDGRARGETPVMIDVSSGEQHRVELRVDGGVVASEAVTLSAHEERELHLETPAPAPRRARLRVVTIPAGASVTVAGEHRGETPLELAVAPGEYPVQVRADGYEPQEGRAVLRDPTETETLSFVLAEAPAADRAGQPPRRRATGTLVIATTPWSDVFLGGRKLGTTPLGNVQLPAGRHTLTLRTPDRAPRRHTVTIRPNQETRVRLAL